MLPTATISHSIQGRTRLHIPSRKGDAAYFAELKQAFAANDAVSDVKTNLWTGSVLLHHHTDIDDLADEALAQGLFKIQSPTLSPNKALNAASDWMDQSESLLKRVSQGTVDIQELLFVGLIGAAIVQLLRGKIMSPASVLLTNAIGILMMYRAKRAHQDAASFSPFSEAGCNGTSRPR